MRSMSGHGIMGGKEHHFRDFREVVGEDRLKIQKLQASNRSPSPQLCLFVVVRGGLTKHNTHIQTHADEDRFKKISPMLSIKLNVCFSL